MPTETYTFTEEELNEILEEDQQLLRAIQTMCQSPFFRQVKRFVEGYVSDGDEKSAVAYAMAIGQAVRDICLNQPTQ